jgi:HTH-type transcriptional regulator/antitoxin HipB
MSKRIIMTSIARTPAHIGAAIRRQRKLKAVTQVQLGETTKLRQATISQLENGEGSIQLKTLTDVLSALNLELVIQERSSGRSIEDIF